MLEWQCNAVRDFEHADVNDRFVTFLGAPAKSIADETPVLIPNRSYTMLITIKTALSALLVVGLASTAMASDSSESQGRQAYPFISQAAHNSIPASAYAYAPANDIAKAITAAEQRQFARSTEAALSQ